MKAKGFSLIETLVVVLIVGILTALAVPQYQKAVEKSRMAEAVMIVRQIANANQAHYDTYGRYADYGEIDNLDISIPGYDYYGLGGKRVATKYFIYSPCGSGSYGARIALATEIKDKIYQIYIEAVAPERIRCAISSGKTPSSIQKKLCKQLDANGTL